MSVRLGRWQAVLFLMVAMPASPFAKIESLVSEPASFRLNDYRAPVPATVDGHLALTTGQAADLWRGHKAVFIDTLPQAPRPEGLPTNTIWHPKLRYDIPGSVWLPDTGYGELASITKLYFEHGLQQATSGDRSLHVIFYCLASCWMSWNATKRARMLGYSNVDWYADGTDGWAASDLPLELRDPVPRLEN